MTAGPLDLAKPRIIWIWLPGEGPGKVRCKIVHPAPVLPILGQRGCRWSRASSRGARPSEMGLKNNAETLVQI